MLNKRLDLPQPVVPLFWGLLLLEATFGAYLGIWPLWIEKLGAPIATVGFVLGIGGFMRLFVLIPSAKIAERFGYRRTIVIAWLVAICGLLFAAFATDWTQLILTVAATAVGEMVFPLIQTLVATEAGDQKMRSFALVFNVGPSIALAISPLVSAVAVAQFGMRAALILAACWSAASLFMLWRIEEPPKVESTKERPTASYSMALQNHSLRILCTLLALLVFSMSLGISFVPTFLEDVRGMEPASISALASLAAVGSAIFGLAVARVAKLQRYPFASACVAIGAMAISFIIFTQTSAPPLLAVAFLFRGGLFSAWAMVISILGQAVPQFIQSRSFAILEMVGGVSYALGPMVAGLLYSHRPTLPMMLATLLALFLLIPLYLVVQWRLGDRFHAGDTEIGTLEPATA